MSANAWAGRSALSGLFNRFKFDWPPLSRDTWRADLIAGLSGAIILLPQGMAYALIAGLPPEYGIYCAIVPAIVAALFGSSWHLVSGPTAAISIVVFSALAPLAPAGSGAYIALALTLSLMVGLIQLALGLARLGSLVNFISHSVVIGFTAGAAFQIAASQIGNFFGLAIPRGTPFFGILQWWAGHWADINPYVVSVSLATLLTGILVRRYLKRVPYMLAAMLIGSIVAYVIDRAVGAGSTGIKLVGALPSALPAWTGPVWSADVWRQLAMTALAIALLGLTEAVSIARAIALRSGQRIDGSREFVGQGLSNAVGAFFLGYPSSGSFTRSGVNLDAGAKTPFATVFASSWLVLIVLAVAPLAAYLPMAAMAGILLLVAYGLIELPYIRNIAKTDRRETAVLLITFGATLFLQLEFAIYAGVLLSLFFYLDRTSKPRVRPAMLAPAPVGAYHLMERPPGTVVCPQLRTAMLDGSLYFGAIQHVADELRRNDPGEEGQKHLLVMTSGVNFIDLAGAEMLAAEARKRQAQGGSLHLLHLKRPVREELEAAGGVKAIGAANIHKLGEPVIDKIFATLDPNICARCTRRIFPICRRPGSIPILPADEASKASEAKAV